MGKNKHLSFADDADYDDGCLPRVDLQIAKVLRGNVNIMWIKRIIPYSKNLFDNYEKNGKI
jgi:hypothetical protein